MSLPQNAIVDRLLPLVLMFVLAAAVAPVSKAAEGNKPMTVEEIKHAVLGNWASITPELRPSAIKNPDGTLKPFYLTREFKALPDDRFELTIVNFVDPYGKTPLTRIFIKGHMLWRGEHPIAAGAHKVDFVADEAYEVTPLLQGFADLVNQSQPKAMRSGSSGIRRACSARPSRLLASPQARTSWNMTWCISRRTCCSGERATSTDAVSTPDKTARPTFKSPSFASEDYSVITAAP